jgi:hypothetical protein
MLPSRNIFVTWFVMLTALPFSAQTSVLPPTFEIATRMEIDVDGAPNAYGPRGKKTLDNLMNAHYLERGRNKIVGYLLENDDPRKPVVQGSRDPCPGYYVSTTAYEDHAIEDDKNPLKYVDATKINYVVLGNTARRRGARVGDFVAVYSRRHKVSVYGIIGDSGNPSGQEGSLHLLQALGYPFRDGKSGSVEGKDIVVRFFPQSNPGRLFFRTQEALDEAAEKLGLSRDFAAVGASKH